MSEVSELARHVARQLDHLMTTGHPDGTGPRNYRGVADASHAYAADHPGEPTISPQAVLNLREGKVANPGVNSLQALANVYQVPITYFFHAPTGDEKTPSAPSPDPRTVLTRLALLISIVERRDLDGTYTEQELAKLIRRHGAQITDDDLMRLGRGEWQDALAHELGALATRLGVPPAFFSDDKVAARATDELQLLVAMKELGVRQIAMRQLAAMPEEDLNAIAPMLQHLMDKRRKPAPDA